MALILLILLISGYLDESFVVAVCPQIYGQSSLVNVEGLRVYLDPSVDEELQNVAALLSILEDPDGKVSLINNGEVSSFFATTTGGSYATIPSAVQQVPLHIVANNELYYSLSIISQNETVLGPFNDITPNNGVLLPGDITDNTVDFCCRENGTVILEGCITVGTEPFEHLNGVYMTIGPFYSVYRCEDRYQRLCDPSFPIFTLIAEICLSRNQSISLVTAGEGSWDLLVGTFDPEDRTATFCTVGYINNGLQPNIKDPETNRRLPIGVQFPGLEMFFRRDQIPYINTTFPVIYSMSLSSRDTSILGPPEADIPLEGLIFEEDLYFFMTLPCLTIGVTNVDVHLDFSTIVEGIVFNNTFDFFFTRNCTPTDTVHSSPPKKRESQIIISSTLLLAIFIIIIIIVIVLVLLLVSRRQKQHVKHLEELAQHQIDNPNLYALNTVNNPFEFLDEYHIEYNFALVDIVDELGEGYFGNVFKARAPGLVRGDYTAGEFVAVKTLKDDANPERLQDFAKEVSVCVQFDHPNIVRLLGVCTASAQRCMIFEYMDLGSLDYCLRSSNPNDEDYSPSGFSLIPDNFLSLVLQLSRAMDYLASLNFVHRDIASRNCLLDSEFTAKIADFGLSRNISAQNYYRIGAGKKNYLPIRWMPPEALLYGKFTLKSDVWSFGTLMWEVYTYGQLPYTGLSNHEVIDFIKDSKVLERPDNCPMGVYDIMRSCWVRIPSQRPSMKQIMNRLELYSRGEVDPAREYVNLAPEKENYVSSNN